MNRSISRTISPSPQRLRDSWLLFVFIGFIATCSACAGGEEADPNQDVMSDVTVDQTGDNVLPDGSDVPTDSPGDSQTDTPGDSPDDTTDTPQDGDVPPVPGLLGKQCGANLQENCLPGTTGFPSCANVQCDGDPCVLVFDDIGFCSGSCETDADCQSPDESSIVGNNFTCVKGTNTSFCLPGSQTACTSNADCPGGEVCKLSFVEQGGDLVLGPVCQTATAGGAGPGEGCNTNPEAGTTKLCSNDMCFGSRCSAFCDSASAGACGGGVLECVADVSIEEGLLADLCIGIECEKDSDCTAPGYSCAPPQLLGDPGSQYLSGRCVWNPDGTALGEACVEDTDCASGWCFEVTEGIKECSVLCRSDSDCDTGQKCGAIQAEPEMDMSQGLPVCLPAEGSLSTCNGDVDCSSGEVCRTYVVGAPRETDPYFFSGSVQTFCAAPVDPAGGDPGASCNPGNCKSDWCVTTDGGVSFFCSSPCVDTGDCPGNLECAGVLPIFDQNDMNSANDISIQLCAPP